MRETFHLKTIKTYFLTTQQHLSEARVPGREETPKRIKQQETKVSVANVGEGKTGRLFLCLEQTLLEEMT